MTAKSLFGWREARNTICNRVRWVCAKRTINLSVTSKKTFWWITRYEKIGETRVLEANSGLTVEWMGCEEQRIELYLRQYILLLLNFRFFLWIEQNACVEFQFLCSFPVPISHPIVSFFAPFSSHLFCFSSYLFSCCPFISMIPFPVEQPTSRYVTSVILRLTRNQFCSGKQALFVVFPANCGQLFWIIHQCLDAEFDRFYICALIRTSTLIYWTFRLKIVEETVTSSDPSVCFSDLWMCCELVAFPVHSHYILELSTVFSVLQIFVVPLSIIWHQTSSPKPIFLVLLLLLQPLLFHGRSFQSDQLG